MVTIHCSPEKPFVIRPGKRVELPDGYEGEFGLPFEGTNVKVTKNEHLIPARFKKKGKVEKKKSEAVPVEIEASAQAVSISQEKKKTTTKKKVTKKKNAKSKG